MSFIGIITNKSNRIDLEYILKSKKIPETNIIILRPENIENIKNVKFDILIINYGIKFYDKIKDIIKNAKIILINIDIKFDRKIFENIETYVITYGFNNRATVMITSSEQDEVILDIQRYIKSVNNKYIENKVIKIFPQYSKKYIYEEVVGEILKILYG